MLKTTTSTHRVGTKQFLNINITNEEGNTQAIPASISTTLRTPVVENPSKCNLIISRFSIPGRAIPIFFYQTTPYPNTNVNLGIYTIVIGYQGNYTTPVHLQLIPEVFKAPLIPVFSTQAPNQDPLDTYYYVYSYVNLANMVTIALRAAIAQGITAGWLDAGTDAYMTYNNQSGYFSLFGTQSMASSFNPTDPDNVQIWMNTPLATFFAGFKNIHNDFNSSDGLDEMILIEDDRNNSPTTQDGFNPNIPDGYYQIQLEFNSDANLETLSRIVITSNTFGGVVAQSEISTSLAEGTYQNVLADFIPGASTTNGSYRSKIQYFPQSEFYRRSLTGTSPLFQIELTFYWQGVRPNIYRPLLIEPNENLNIQFILEECE